MIRGPECFKSGKEKGTGPLRSSLAAALSHKDEAHVQLQVRTQCDRRH